jgi:hypothetical protein
MLRFTYWAARGLWTETGINHGSNCRTSWGAIFMPPDRLFLGVFTHTGASLVDRLGRVGIKPA